LSELSGNLNRHSLNLVIQWDAPPDHVVEHFGNLSAKSKFLDPLDWLGEYPIFLHPSFSLFCLPVLIQQMPERFPEGPKELPGQCIVPGRQLQQFFAEFLALLYPLRALLPEGPIGFLDLFPPEFRLGVKLSDDLFLLFRWVRARLTGG
jgi:hypothetical protein